MPSRRASAAGSTGSRRRNSPVTDGSMMSNRDRLIYMAEQIARNLASLGHDHAVAATADHIESFWDPRMKAQIFAIASEDPGLLSDMVAAAVARLSRGHVPPQSRATQFNAVDQAGRSDAG